MHVCGGQPGNIRGGVGKIGGGCVADHIRAAISAGGNAGRAIIIGAAQIGGIEQGQIGDRGGKRRDKGVRPEVVFVRAAVDVVKAGQMIGVREIGRIGVASDKDAIVVKGNGSADIEIGSAKVGGIIQVGTAGGDFGHKGVRIDVKRVAAHKVGLERVWCDGKVG